MATRKIGRKARALERAKSIKRHHDFVDKQFQKRRDQEASPGKREEKRQQVEAFVTNHPGVSTRIVERRFGMHRDTITNIREEIGFVVPKKDYRCFKATGIQYNWPKQPGERPGICACGCGGQTTQTKNGNNKTGMKPGDFFRFIHGHQWLLRRRLMKPKGWRSSHDINREREELRKALVHTAAKLPRYTKDEVATFEDLRNRLKKIELNGHSVTDQSVSRMLNIGRVYLFGFGADIPSFVHANKATKAEWLERLISVSASMGRAAIDFTELRARFSEPMLFSKSALSRILRSRRSVDPNVPVVTFRRTPELTRKVEPITEHYPFGLVQDDLLQFILSIIPDRYSSDVRGDIAQDMALAVISGTCDRNDLQENLGTFISGYYKKFSAGRAHNMVSLDAPVHSHSGNLVNLHELIGAEQTMTEFYGGMNYETQQSYYERVNDAWDGRIVARY